MYTFDSSSSTSKALFVRVVAWYFSTSDTRYIRTAKMFAFNFLTQLMQKTMNDVHKHKGADADPPV